MSELTKLARRFLANAGYYQSREGEYSIETRSLLRALEVALDEHETEQKEEARKARRAETQYAEAIAEQEREYLERHRHHEGDARSADK